MNAPHSLRMSYAQPGRHPRADITAAGKKLLVSKRRHRARPRTSFVSAFLRTDWTDGQMLAFCPVVSCVCADGASVLTSVRTFDDRTDATDWRGVPRLLLPCLVLLGGMAGGGWSGGET